MTESQLDIIERGADSTTLELVREVRRLRAAITNRAATSIVERVGDKTLVEADHHSWTKPYRTFEVSPLVADTILRIEAAARVDAEAMNQISEIVCGHREMATEDLIHTIHGLKRDAGRWRRRG